MSDWPVRTLEELCTRITVGHVGSMAHEYIPNGVPFLRSQNIRRGSLDLSSVKYISKEFHQRLTKSALLAGDLAIVRTGEPGATALIPDGIGEMNCSDIVIARPGSDVDGQFLCYAINATAQRFIDAHTVGAVQQHFNVSSAKKLSLAVPPLTVQRSIADTLSALDDKIAVNDRIATCSLALADAHFSEAVAGVAVGPETFNSVAQVGGGGTPSTKAPEYWDGNIAWTTPSDVTALRSPYLFDTNRKITTEGLDNCASPLYPAGSIFMTSRATIGAFAIPQVPAAVNQGFIVVVAPDKPIAMWLFHEMRDRVDEMRSLANGSTFLELSRKNFKAMSIRMPGPAKVAKFAEIAIPLHQKAAAVSAENATLLALRDTLLPELMSGRLRVKDAEKVVEEAV
ncbi:restriction endonuclease subunit S [Solwaraspora sp. WMMD937]|uniref:restriction endonuclease subunit S n=1 Tax=Solwaraspora sp. WMMD937 TaxID=3016090 RepID=UPI00249A599D|nr:restriction endonuclease subunit S [Solwaraspora sp. WMMD937]WFE22487.1 restriction endonuclease subunit S [Solwaraspora sp. WMMD937]